MGWLGISWVGLLLSLLRPFMLLQSSGGWSCLIQDEYAHTSGNWRRTVGRLEVLSLFLFLLVWRSLYGQLGLLYMLERIPVQVLTNSLPASCLLLPHWTKPMWAGPVQGYECGRHGFWGATKVKVYHSDSLLILQWHYLIV